MALLQSINAKKNIELLVRNYIICFQFALTVTAIFDKYEIQNSMNRVEKRRRSKSLFTSKVKM